MARHTETHRVPYSAQQMFDLVVDVARYPCFVPGYIEANVERLDEGRLAVDQAVGLGGAPLRFRSLAVAKRPESIAIEAQGAFRGLRIHWRFLPVESGCNVIFNLHYSRPLGFMAAPWIPLFSRRVVSSFLRRAADLYGESR